MVSRHRKLAELTGTPVTRYAIPLQAGSAAATPRRHPGQLRHAAHSGSRRVARWEYRPGPPPPPGMASDRREPADRSGLLVRRGSRWEFIHYSFAEHLAAAAEAAKMPGNLIPATRLRMNAPTGRATPSPILPSSPSSTGYAGSLRSRQRC